MNETNSINDLELLLDNLEALKIEGRDKQGRKILRIIGKFFPARALSGASGERALRSYLESKIFPELEGKEFCVVYVHTGVQRADNFPGVSALRVIYESLPPGVRAGLHTVYFVHPGFQARLFLATVGRLLFSDGLYGKVKYVSRITFLWEHVRRVEMKIPEFVYHHDDELERRPLMDYGIESDHHRVYDAPAMDSAASMYSLRCSS